MEVRNHTTDCRRTGCLDVQLFGPLRGPHRGSASKCGLGSWPGRRLASFPPAPRCGIRLPASDPLFDGILPADFLSEDAPEVPPFWKPPCSRAGPLPKHPCFGSAAGFSVDAMLPAADASGRC